MMIPKDLRKMKEVLGRFSERSLFNNFFIIINFSKLSGLTKSSWRDTNNIGKALYIPFSPLRTIVTDVEMQPAFVRSTISWK